MKEISRMDSQAKVLLAKLQNLTGFVRGIWTDASARRRINGHSAIIRWHLWVEGPHARVAFAEVLKAPLITRERRIAAAPGHTAAVEVF